MFYKIPFTGDINSEFSHLVLAVVVIAILSFAWWTTNIRDNWQVRAVYFLDTRLSSSSSQLQRLTNHTVSSTIVESTAPNTNSTHSQSDPVTEVVDSVESTTEEEEEQEPKTSEITEVGECSNFENKDGPSAIIKKMDADSELVREKRLEFFNKRRDTLIDPNEGSSSSNSNQSSSTMDTDIIEETNMPQTEVIECSVDSNCKAHTNSDDIQSSENIKIKLKYLNDDLKIVDGHLSELLGEFKRRHFETEISENKLVKLIFNGQLLQRDNDSLQSYGFFNNCVVHCLIHQQRIIDEENTDGSNINNTRNRNSRSSQRDWDLGNLFIILVSVFLSSAWYFRYQYPQFFTITATMALVIITGLFAVISLGTFFPDPEVQTPETHIIH